MPDNPYADLRLLALSLTADQIGVTPTAEHPRVFGAVMEIGLDEGSATVVALHDGTVSMYLSSGGGIIGGGGQEAVWAAALEFLRQAEADLEQFTPDAPGAPPGAGIVRFYALTFGGLMAAEARDSEVTDAAHPLAPLFNAGQGVITAMQEASPDP